MWDFQDVDFSYCAAYVCYYGDAEHKVQIETVSKMLGHRSLKQTMLYAKILDVKISEDMKEVRERLTAG